MKFTRHGKLRKDVVETIKPLDKVEEFNFRRLNCLLDYLLVSMPAIYYEFIDKLNQRWHTLIKAKAFDEISEDLQKLIEKYVTLRDQPVLMSLQLSLFIQILQISEATLLENNPIEIPLSNFTKSAFIPEYNWVSVLSDLIGKDEAISLFERAMERYVVKYDTDTIINFENLEEMRQAFLKFIDSGRLGRLRVSSNVVDGKWILRCDNCEKVESLGDLSGYDREVMYAVKCHTDFQVTRLFNENFVLTRSVTVAEGNPYCDFVYHDIRYDKKLSHPSKEFIENMSN
ncbi:MAG: L-2-amino-thiazoline-4-carboxylic acid hydrolase [Candidatus Thorarchaeota archaeon]